MLIDESPRSFVKKNNSYSHCPLKKRPVTVVLSEEIPKTEIKEEENDEIIVDDNSEPENLSTKPEDLSKSAEKRQRSRSPSPLPAKIRRFSDDTLPVVHPASMPSPPPTLHHHQHHHHQYQPMFPSKALTPPAGIAPIHPVAKRARVEVLQHESCPTVTSASAAVASTPMHFLNSAVDPLNPYAGHNWARAAAAPPLYPPHYLPYASAFRYQQPSGAEALYPAYPVPAYHEHQPEQPQLIHRPIAKSYAPWVNPQSPDHGLPSSSPTLSLGSSVQSLRSPPPPISPEDLSSPGSDSGRSSAGSVSTGPPLTPRPHDLHHHHLHTHLQHSHLKSSNHHNNNNNSTSNNNITSVSTSPRYQCPNCAKSYSTYSGLSKHQQFHCAAAEGQTKKTFSCKYCEKLYLTLGALKMHIRTHTLPCKCHLCGKAFSRPWLLQGHIRTHTGEKPFSCQHCNRAFADRSNLRAHLQTHSDVKKYSCQSCSKTFSRMSLLTKHQEGGCPGGVPTPGAAMVYAC